MSSGSQLGAWLQKHVPSYIESVQLTPNLFHGGTALPKIGDGPELPS